MWRTVRAFVLGMWEFRSDLTTHFDDYRTLCIYDAGRDFAHCLTLRYWDGE